MQFDMGGLWRQEVLRRMGEAERAKATPSPASRPAGPRLITVWWRAAADAVRGLAPRRSSPAPQTGATAAPPAEIDVRDPVEQRTTAPDPADFSC
jgi:hypothetical protein